MTFDAKAAAQRIKLEQEAELRYRYIVRAENENQIRVLEQVLGRPVSRP